MCMYCKDKLQKFCHEKKQVAEDQILYYSIYVVFTIGVSIEIEIGQ